LAFIQLRRVLAAFKHLAKIHPEKLQKLVLAKEAALRELRDRQAFFPCKFSCQMIYSPPSKFTVGEIVGSVGFESASTEFLNQGLIRR
jgi:hypothetical protein